MREQTKSKFHHQKGGVSISKKFEIELTINELLQLDGKVSESAQKIIDEAKKESSYGFDDLPIINEIIKQSEKNGKLTWTYKSIRSCGYCDKKPDYKRYPRSGRYHSKGDKNFDKPIYYSGIKFNEGFITISGHGDMCLECCREKKVKERIIDYIIDNDLKIEIMKNDYKLGKYLKDDIRICYSCNTEIQESEMTKEPTMMGDGYYPSGCPKCGAKSSMFGNNHKVTNKFGFINNPQFEEEVRLIKEYIDNYNKDKERDERIYLSQGKNTITSFSVLEEKWSNGNHKIIQFGITSKNYTLGYGKDERTQDIKNILDDFNYKEKEK
ncbi:hypothetical protein SAMN04487895_101611 [Paenibacillus sophorae]|uniref:Uncharacterized protein n=1 Tax=Paenibacillus sophorae TaxID=1333845 RepID=A0A1H8GQP8_9BACL|nr:hypothetical protein [Paenibacillus sophorae]QWU14309.1 hypothetical protein KP014_20595 [Paenibacillus sophorae]SEN46342.1 hypothetical protein SAMN04487895_101611 [Paenibacillus sophorae]